MRRRALYLACGIPLGILCFLLLTLLFTPNDTLKGLLVRVAENHGYTLVCTGFGKSFPLGVKAKGVEISSQKGPLLRLRDARVRLELLPLVAGKLRIGYRGKIGAGELRGEADLSRGKGGSLQCKGVPLEEIPFFSTVAGARVKGELRFNGEVVSGKGPGQGDLQLQVRSAELASVKIGEMPLPDASYKEIRGALRIENGRAVLKSFTLEGDGIYMRLKGESMLTTPVGNSGLNLTLEMMPKPVLLERQKWVFLLLTKYQTSPGVYNIPIHGTLAHPSI